MNRLISVLFVLGLVLATPAAAAAQTLDNKLKGVTQVALTFEPFDADSAKCGVDEARMTYAITRKAKAIPVRFDGSTYVFQVRVATLAQPAICFSSADIELYRFDRVHLTGDKRELHAKVMIWENGTILGSGPASHGLDVARAMEQLVQQFIEDWRKDNG